MDSRDGLSLITGLECGLDRWTGSLDWIAGVDCWTGFSKESCQAIAKTPCVVETSAWQVHMDVAQLWK